MANMEADEEETGVIMLVQHYAGKFGITFSSGLLQNPEHKAKLMTLMMAAISGKRGPVTDSDILHSDDQID
ncbi:MAG TPA: hypothetical protein VK974_06460 [Methylophilaceae bacterium]|nr:hypothetical protein [Methylophilaceae bacterium]